VLGRTQLRRPDQLSSLLKNPSGGACSPYIARQGVLSVWLPIVGHQIVGVVDVQVLIRRTSLQWFLSAHQIPLPVVLYYRGIVEGNVAHQEFMLFPFCREYFTA